MAASKVLEREIEAYLKKRVKALGGEVRKVTWSGRVGAPDRLVMLPDFWWHCRAGSRGYPGPFFVEVKNPETVLTFPADARERKQAQEHEKMRDAHCRVYVVGTFAQVDELLR